jgi:hypothetical protein
VETLDVTCRRVVAPAPGGERDPREHPSATDDTFQDATQSHSLQSEADS